jgi:hypothetical protein
MDRGVPGRLAPHVRSEWVDGVQRLRLLPPRSWKLVFVTLLLLPFKDLSLLRDLHRPHDWADEAMLALATVVFLMLLVAIVGEFLGSETISVARGELVISRGIGPLRRTFRYPVADIADLTSDDPSAGGYDRSRSGSARHLQLRFGRLKDGAVRFDYLGKTVYLAGNLQEAEGELIVNWLKMRLPRTATAPLPSQDGGGTANWRP